MTEAAGSILTNRTSTGWRYYTRLAINSFATMLDLGLFTLGAALVGVGLAVLLAGFDVVDADRICRPDRCWSQRSFLAWSGPSPWGSRPRARSGEPAFVPHNDYERAIGRAIASSWSD